MIVLKTAAIVALATFVAAPASAKPASRFLNEAVQGDRSEMTLGRIIHSRGESGQVRSFGATLVTDHTSAHSQVISMARRMHIRVSDAMMPQARAELAKLGHLRGRSFDREVRRYMIDDHRKDISDFSDQARHGDRQTAALASQTLPVLRKHLAMARALPS